MVIMTIFVDASKIVNISSIFPLYHRSFLVCIFTGFTVGM